MKRARSKPVRVLGLSPSTGGVGFAVLEDGQKLIDWGVKSIKGDKNLESIKKIEGLILHYRPDLLAFENYEADGSQRHGRVRQLGHEMSNLAEYHKLKVSLLSRKQVLQFFFADGEGTKYAVANILARRFSEELGHRLPPKRKPWMNEDYRMDIFDAVAWALTHFELRVKALPRV
jgi:hypothetical protein